MLKNKCMQCYTKENEEEDNTKGSSLTGNI